MINAGDTEASWNHGGNSTDGVATPLDFLNGRDHKLEFVDVNNIKVHISFAEMQESGINHQFKVLIYT